VSPHEATWHLAFRPARAVDLAELVRIDAASPGGGWTRASFAQELELAWSRVEVALAPGEPEKVAGFLVYWLVQGEVQLLNIASDPLRRRQGLGRTLMQHLVAQARAAAAGEIVLEVRASNSPALALYGALGFVPTGRRVGYYAEGDEDAVLMALALR